MESGLASRKARHPPHPGAVALAFPAPELASDGHFLCSLGEVWTSQRGTASPAFLGGHQAACIGVSGGQLQR